MLRNSYDASVAVDSWSRPRGERDTAGRFLISLLIFFFCCVVIMFCVRTCPAVVFVPDVTASAFITITIVSENETYLDRRVSEAGKPVKKN